MTPSQVAELLAMASAFDRRTVGDADVMAWHLVLRDIDHQDAQKALAAHYSETRDWVMPADIRQRVRTARNDAARDINAGGGKGLPPEIPDADPDDVPAYLAALRAQRTRAAAGELTRPRPVAELAAAVGRQVPAPEVEAVRRPGPLGVRCPVCHAPIGKPCRTQVLGRRMADVHPSRLEASRRAA